MIKAALLIVSSLTLVTAGVIAWRPGARAEMPETALAPDAPFERGEVHGIGFLEPVGEVRALAYRVAGVVDRCLVEPGSPVDAGTLLGELTSKPLQAEAAVARRRLDLARTQRDQLNAGAHPRQVDAARHDVARLREKAEWAERDASRFERLRNERATNDREIDDAHSSVREAAAALARAEAELALLDEAVRAEDRARADAEVALAEAQVTLVEARIEETRLRAPHDGVVLKVLTREGETAHPNEPAFLFGDPRHLRVRVEIDEREVHRVQPAQRVRIGGRNLGGAVYRGAVAQVLPIMGGKTLFSDAASERRDLDIVEVLIDLEERNVALPIGLRVDVSIDVGLE